MPNTTVTTEYGVRYLNGTEDWDTARWFGSIELPESRETFREQYDLRMSGMGAPIMPLTFLKRVKTITYDGPYAINDNPVETTPEPEIEPPIEGDDETNEEEVIEDGTEPGTDPEPERE